MNIAVCIKVYKGEINPFDECALEEALKIKDASVWVFSMCPPSAHDVLRSLTRLGVHKVIALTDTAFAGSDTLATSYILATELEKYDFDYIFCGRQSVDGDTAQVGPQISARLKLNLITNVLEIKSLGDEAECETRFGTEKVPSPALLTIERINTLRFPSIFSKPGEIEVIDNKTVGALKSRIGLTGSPTKVLKTFENQSGKRKCEFIEAKDFTRVIKKLLLTEKIKLQTNESLGKLKKVWAIGEEVYKKAVLISDDVTLIKETNPFIISDMAKEKKPNAILWNADLPGRKNAPVTAALLESGLCADCTLLETDGEKLYMYRPALGGSTIAKIESTSFPQLATVRCSQKSDDIVVSVGRGAADFIDDVKKFAEKTGASMAASRAIVDKGLAPYSHQVGLTGKTIAPKIYIAVGISGAVQHTCAIEGADFVIAINPDKEAPVFDYADYGIIADFQSFSKVVI